MSGSSAITTRSSARMSARALSAAIALAVLTAGCGGSGSAASKGEQSEAQASSPGDVLTAGQLSTVLLSPADLPAGYQIDTDPDDEDDDTDFGTAECATKLEEFSGDDETNTAAKAERTFSTGEDGFTSLEQTVTSVKDEDEFADSLDAFADIIDDCGQLTFSADGQPATLTLSKVEVPEHGDDTLGIRMKGQISAFPFELVFGINRLGHNVQTVFVGGLGEADMGALRQAMDTGFARLEKAHTADPDTAVASAAPEPASTLRTGGPGAYTGTSEDGVQVELSLPAPAEAPLAGEVNAYLRRVGGEFADTTLVQVTVTNNSSDSTYLGGVTVVTADGTQVELDDLIMLLNDTDEADPDAYSEVGGDLNSKLAEAQVTELKPRAKATQLYALRGVAPAEVVDVYVDAGSEDIQLGLK